MLEWYVWLHILMIVSDCFLCLAGRLWGCLWLRTGMERIAVGGFENHASSCEGRNTHAYARAFAPSKVVSQIFLLVLKELMAEQHATYMFSSIQSERGGEKGNVFVSNVNNRICYLWWKERVCIADHASSISCLMKISLIFFRQNKGS